MSDFCNLFNILPVFSVDSFDLEEESLIKLNLAYLRHHPLWNPIKVLPIITK